VGHPAANAEFKIHISTEYICGNREKAVLVSGWDKHCSSTSKTRKYSMSEKVSFGVRVKPLADKTTATIEPGKGMKPFDLPDFPAGSTKEQVVAWVLSKLNTK
jgi:hypothetical protein